MTEATPAASGTPPPFGDPSRFDPLEEAIRGPVRAFIEQLLEEELAAAPPGAASTRRGGTPHHRRTV